MTTQTLGLPEPHDLPQPLVDGLYPLFDGPVFVGYHGGDHDGFTAGWLTRHALLHNHRVPSPFLHLQPLEYNESLQLETAEIYFFLDFTPSEDVLVDLTTGGADVVVLDHHTTGRHRLIRAIKSLSRSGYSIHSLRGPFSDERDVGSIMVPDDDRQPGSLRAFLTDRHSAAMIAFLYFFGAHPLGDAGGVRVPRMIEYVEDYDLWHKEMPNCDAVHYLMSSYEMSSDTWYDLLMRLENNETLRDVIREGLVLQRHIRKVVREAADHARMMVLGEYTVPTVSSTVHTNEIADELCVRFPEAPFVGVIQYSHDHAFIVSLRRNGRPAHNDHDVSEVAARYGGGGHPRSAAFKISMTDFLEQFPPDPEVR